jgi:hypothetical protein
MDLKCQDVNGVGTLTSMLGCPSRFSGSSIRLLYLMSGLMPRTHSEKRPVHVTCVSSFGNTSPKSHPIPTNFTILRRPFGIYMRYYLLFGNLLPFVTGLRLRNGPREELRKMKEGPCGEIASLSDLTQNEPVQTAFITRI